MRQQAAVRGVHQVRALRFDPAGLHPTANSAGHVGSQIIADVQNLPERHIQTLRRKAVSYTHLTIDLRVDYLRPGRGERFTATSTLLRAGNKVAVARVELHNEAQVYIASATATYMVG